MIRALLAVAITLAGMAQAEEACEQYRHHESCMLQGVGCVWDVFSSNCHQVDKGPHCGIHPHKSTCEQLHYCQWNDDYAACHDKGGTFDCHYFHTGDDCKSNPGKCTWDSKMSFCTDNDGHGKGHHCQMLDDELECGSGDKCVWLSQRTECHSKGLGHCDGGLEKEDCALVDCHWDGDQCVQSEDHIVCEEKFDESTCNNQKQRCLWDETGSFCYNKGFDAPPCHKFYEEDGCVSHEVNCDWHAGAHTCVPKGTPLQCDRVYEEDACREVSDCDWNKLGHICHKKGRELPCEIFYDESACRAQQGCSFHHHSCYSEDDFTSCAELKTRNKCERYHCMFKESQGCVDAPDSDVHGDTMQPSEIDMGDATDMPDIIQENGEIDNDMHAPPAASTFEAKEKPDCSDVKCDSPPTCTGSDKLATHTYECCPRCSYSENTCMEFLDPGLCPSSCEWSEHHYVCLALGQPIPCDRVYEEIACKDNELGCDWHPNAWTCTSKGEKPDCERYYDEDHCPTDKCIFNKEANNCHHKDKKVDCVHFYEAEPCAAADHCSWDEHANTCTEQGDPLECDRYYEEDGCAAQGKRCVFVAATNRCLDATKPLPCDAFNEETCRAQDHCSWIGMISQCSVKQDFEPLPCEEHYEEQDCKDHETGDCVWEEHSSICHHKDVIPECDRHFSKEGCGSQADCKWHESVMRCTEKDTVLKCDDHHEEAHCPSHCDWHTEAHLCNPKGEPVPCDRMWEEQHCAASEHCAWNEATYMCRHKDETKNKFDCEAHPAEDTCGKMSGCTWYPISQRCLAEGKDLDCDLRWSVESCGDKVGSIACTWHEVANSCAPEGEEVGCEKIYMDEGCKGTSGCGWDPAMSRCRKLRVKMGEL